ncbi:MAG: UDP-N-acetylmuramate--L-alanine ligase [Alphaproteobacteria bacterium]
MQMPVDIGKIHFVGVGGIGMSGIAEILVNLGYEISGSDINESDTTKRLADKGVKIFIGQKSENVIGANAVVVSTAIKPDNPEYVSAKKNNIPIVHRSEMLAEVMRLRLSIAIAGTHGKTTTTTLVAHALSEADMQPTVINGGIINKFGSNAKLGEGKWLVAEADESDGSFTRLPATIAVVSNIDAEHLDFYGDFDAVKEAFYRFVENIPFYGVAILCTDNEEVKKLRLQIDNRRIVTYGFNNQADVRAENVRSDENGTTFDVVLKDETIKDIFIPIHGEHNIQNTLASIAVALEVGVETKKIQKLYEKFNGVKRRFTNTGTLNGARVIDDYAHHPVEIKATLQAGRSGTTGKVHAIMQPHRYTRLQSLFDDFATCFDDADNVHIIPVYSANEDEIDGINSKSLTENIITSGHSNASFCDSFDKLKSVLSKSVDKDDIVIFMGAGDITKWAYQITDD